MSLKQDLITVETRNPTSLRDKNLKNLIIHTIKLFDQQDFKYQNITNKYKHQHPISRLIRLCYN